MQNQKKMTSFFSAALVLLSFMVFSGCTDGDSVGFFRDPSSVAIDSTNNRLFVVQARGEMLVFEASSQEEIGDQPAIQEEETPELHALMPLITQKMVVFSTGTTSRLFIMGTFQNEEGDFVQNRVRVLDFNGTSFSEPSFSPLIITDADDTTQESQNSFSTMLIDQETGSLYIADATAALIYEFDAATGAQSTAPVSVFDQPQALALDGDKLYVCYSSSEEAEQVVHVFNKNDLSSFSTIDTNAPCRDLSVASNASATVLVFQHYLEQEIQILSVDTTTFAAASLIPAADVAFEDGKLLPNQGISSVILSFVVGESDGELFAYLGEQDGNVRFISFNDTVTEFTHEVVATTGTGILSADVLLANDSVENAFFVASSGSLLTVDFGTNLVDLKQ